MYFNGNVKCADFTPNRFRKNVCTLCQSLIQNHSGAKEEFIKAAIEYSADNLPSKVWSHPGEGGGGHLFMGGFKASVNLKFLTESRVKLVVCAAKGLVQTFGSKFKKQIEQRRSALPDIFEISVDWIDSNAQIIETDVLKNIVTKIHTVITRGDSVLVHCAQGILTK